MIDGSGHLLTHKFIPYNDKIADITEADTANHTLDLAAALTETRTIIGIFFSLSRIAGTGNIRVYPIEAGHGVLMDNTTRTEYIAVLYGTNRIQYALDNAGDDFDAYCTSYVVET